MRLRVPLGQLRPVPNISQDAKLEEQSPPTLTLVPDSLRLGIDEHIILGVESMDQPVVQKVLASLPAALDFAAAGSIEGTLPEVFIQGVGDLALPCRPATVRKVIDLCEIAPYGRGEETLVDTSVRKVWQLGPAKVEIGPVRWNDELEAVLEKAGNALGLPSESLGADFYKLLVYETGSFFTAHRDVEKVSRMVATLVIVLPSAHEGGELLVSHNGMRRRFDFGGPRSSKECRFVSFYADCEHSIEAVTQGYRVALVYNLFLRGNAGFERQATIVPPKRLRDELHSWAKDPGSPSKMIYMLEHQYTRENLSFSNLKGRDRGVADVLSAAAKAEDFDVHLGFLSVHKLMEAVVEYRGYGYRRRRYDDPLDESDVDEGEEIEKSITVSRLVNEDGTRLRMGPLKVTEDEDALVGPHGIDDIKPHKTMVSEDTGNAGASLEKWYRSAALVVWPRVRRHAVLVDGDLQRALGKLLALAWQARQPQTGNGALRDKAVEHLFDALIAHWPERNPRFFSIQERGDDAGRFLKAGLWLSSFAHTKAVISSVLATSASGREGRILKSCVQAFGWERMQPSLNELFSRLFESSFPEGARLLKGFWRSLAAAPELSDEIRAWLVEQAGRCMESFRSWLVDDSVYGRNSRAPKVLESMILLSLRTEDGAFVEGVLREIRAHESIFDLVGCVAPAMLSCKERFDGWGYNIDVHGALLSRCSADVIARLETSVGQKIEKPSDWKRGAMVKCSCADCRDLRAFMESPTRAAFTLKAAEGARRHLQESGSRLDLSFDTEKTGRPYTLICRKTLGTWERETKRRGDELEALSRLRAMNDL